MKWICFLLVALCGFFAVASAAPRPVFDFGQDRSAAVTPPAERGELAIRVFRRRAGSCSGGRCG